MLTASQIRRMFLKFFEEKGHQIVPSAPIVNRNDPTLLFTNAGMNQFKDIFLGNQEPICGRVADTQKCLRVSGKHNDLEEVGVDSYHHTMFEMLGNWSFGDYFKKEAIAWAWELLTKVYRLDKDRLYVTVFEGDPSEGLEPDDEARAMWSAWIDPSRIIPGSKKDNFWEMGDTGPCGPCSEIHIDLRDDAERLAQNGKELVNQDHPLVVEIWNLVFIQFNRLNDGSLHSLPALHVDTGMGFERLAMAIQGKKSNYDTDVFLPLIQYLSQRAGIEYTGKYQRDAMSDIAMRVMADHIRAVSFTIADGELPSANGAGYVIRRILRRAVRYGYSFLHFREPELYQLVPILAAQMEEVFPELEAQQAFVSRVVMEEERAFLRTLEEGLKRLDQAETKGGVLDGQIAFELYDTFGFPIDLTRLIGREKGFQVDESGFDKAMEDQKLRSRAAAVKQTGDWVVLLDGIQDVTFVGYDQLETACSRIIKYRTVEDKKGKYCQIVMDLTPFYPEGGGQTGDTGLLISDDGMVRVTNTIRENDLIIHITEEMPTLPSATFKAVVDAQRRKLTENNHSATHLLHAALRQVLGDHVRQKGSMLNDQYLRFDFSHFQKVSEAELDEITRIVNHKIRSNIAREEARSIQLEEARQMGAMMLFGEKYGDRVRMITFDSTYSRELCGGCHVDHTGRIGTFRIVSESAIASGVRRIEAVTADAADKLLRQHLEELNEAKSAFKSQGSLPALIRNLQDENRTLRKTIESLTEKEADHIREKLLLQAREIESVKMLVAYVEIEDANVIKNLIFQLEQALSPAMIVLGHGSVTKPMLSVIVTKSLADANRFHAGNIVKTLATFIGGGGGGQSFYATAGGKDTQGMQRALQEAKKILGL